MNGIKLISYTGVLNTGMVLATVNITINNVEVIMKDINLNEDLLNNIANESEKIVWDESDIIIALTDLFTQLANNVGR